MRIVRSGHELIYSTPAVMIWKGRGEVVLDVSGMFLSPESALAVGKVLVAAAEEMLQCVAPPILGGVSAI